MDTVRTPAALASLVAANLTPLAGILLLGWSPPAILVAYFVDTFVACGGVMVLVMAHVTGNEHDRPLAGWKDWSKAAIGLAILGGIFAFPMALPVVFVIGDDAGAWSLFEDRSFQAALAVQVLMSMLATARMHRLLKTRSDDDRILARRMLFLIARWVLMFFAVVTGIASLLGPVVGSALLVAIYAGASVYFELFPEAAERLVRGRNAKPIVYDADLEQRNRDRQRPG
jgi:hypothetical protein